MTTENKPKRATRTMLIAAIALIVIASGAIGYMTGQIGTPQPTTTQVQSMTINGAGATFPYPLYSSMTVAYSNVKPNVRFNYQSIGSGGGIAQLTQKTVDFGASDSPLTDAQRQAAPNTVTIPMTIGSVVLAYNIPGVQKGLKLTGSVIADLFLGKVKKWNDPAITSLNPGIQLPDKDILIVHRSDGSGTTFVWTGYLSIVSPEWKEKVGQANAVQWPIGLGSAGNEGVAGLVRGTEYTAGYVELAYALANNMAYAFIQNKEGKFVEPTLDSTRAAAAAASLSLPKGEQSWTSVNLLNAPGADSYPIASFSYILVYKELSVLPTMDKSRAQALVDYMWWASHEGQSYAPKLQYVPLPQSVVALNEQTLKSITFNGQPLLS